MRLLWLKGPSAQGERFYQKREMAGKVYTHQHHHPFFSVSSLRVSSLSFLSPTNRWLWRLCRQQSPLYTVLLGPAREWLAGRGRGCGSASGKLWVRSVRSFVRDLVQLRTVHQAGWSGWDSSGCASSRVGRLVSFHVPVLSEASAECH